jgi:iron complex outermembrane receptor protein
MTDLTLDADAGYAPHHDAHVRADWRLGELGLASAQVNHVAGRARAAGDLRPPVAKYTTVDLTLRGAPRRSGWSAALSLRNLFNADVREPSLAPGVIPNDLPQAPRAAYLELSYRY